MPTFATVPLENLLEPRVRDSIQKPLQEDRNQRTGSPRHLYISPALYLTPEQAPIPEYSSPDPLSPSPYVVNHKGRRGGDETRRVDATEATDFRSGDDGGEFSLAEVVGNNFVNENLVGDDDVGDYNDGDNDSDDEGFLDSRNESMSVEGEVEASDVVGRQIESSSFVSDQGDFVDANDDFSSDGSISNTPSYASRIETQLRGTRLSILEEIEKRRTAEETLLLMQSQWQRISNFMSQAGFSFPAPPAANNIMQLENNSIDQLCQEVVVTRFVAEAIGREQARAEAEEAAATIIKSKEQEILRLRDRLQYYETVNHELSQRKLLEVARKQQEKKRNQRRWIWSFMGLSIAVGASFVAYSYIPHSSKYLSSLKSGELTDVSCVGPSDT